MASTFLLRQNVLKSFSLLRQGPKNFNLRGESSLSSEELLTSGLKSFSSDSFLKSLSSVLRDRWLPDKQKTISVIGIIPRSLSVPSVAGSYCQSCYHISDLLLSDPKKRSLESPMQRSLMTACSSMLGRLVLSAQNNKSLNPRNCQMPNFIICGDACNHRKQIDCLVRVSGSLGNKEPRGDNTIYRFFWSATEGKSWSLNPLSESETKDLHSSSAVSNSVGPAADVSFQRTAGEEGFINPTGSSDQ